MRIERFFTYYALRTTFYESLWRKTNDTNEFLFLRIAFVTAQACYFEAFFAEKSPRYGLQTEIWRDFSLLRRSKWHRGESYSRFTFYGVNPTKSCWITIRHNPRPGARQADWGCAFLLHRSGRLPSPLPCLMQFRSKVLILIFKRISVQ